MVCPRLIEMSARNVSDDICGAKRRNWQRDLTGVCGLSRGINFLYHRVLFIAEHRAKAKDHKRAKFSLDDLVDLEVHDAFLGSLRWCYYALIRYGVNRNPTTMDGLSLASISTSDYHRHMDNSTLPKDPEDVREALLTLTTPQVRELAAMSGVSEPALLKVKYGKVANPGIFTVAKFWRNIKAIKAKEQQ